MDHEKIFSPPSDISFSIIVEETRADGIKCEKYFKSERL